MCKHVLECSCCRIHRYVAAHSRHPLPCQYPTCTCICLIIFSSWESPFNACIARVSKTDSTILTEWKASDLSNPSLLASISQLKWAGWVVIYSSINCIALWALDRPETWRNLEDLSSTFLTLTASWRPLHYFLHLSAWGPFLQNFHSFLNHRNVTNFPQILRFQIQFSIELFHYFKGTESWEIIQNIWQKWMAQGLNAVRTSAGFWISKTVFCGPLYLPYFSRGS